jgi:hypothetical protein
MEKCASMEVGWEVKAAKKSEPVSWRVTHHVLQRFTEMKLAGQALRIRWEEVGGVMRRDLSTRDCWRFTVAQKLAHLPMISVTGKGQPTMSMVEAIYLSEASAAELRNRIEEMERLERRGQDFFAFLGPEIRSCRKQYRTLSETIAELYRRKDEWGRNYYDEGMEALCRMFGECAAEDPAFLMPAGR